MINGEPVVLDASALLALFHREKGWEEVDRVMTRDNAEVYMSAVNYAEVLSKVALHGKTPALISEVIHALGIRVIDFDFNLAEQTGILKPKTSEWGFSLGDCACLTLAKHLNATALTADTAWTNFDASFRVKLIR